MDFWKFQKSATKSIYVNDENTITNRYFEKIKDDSCYISDEMDNDFRKAAVIHKLVRNDVRKKLVPGAKYKDLVTYTEDKIIALCGFDRKTYFNELRASGPAFPVGVSVNNIIAHDSALLFDNRELHEGDVVKFDFGVHVNGNIIDSAFTEVVGKSEEYQYDDLLNASKDATYSAISVSGPDARLFEISEIIEEVIYSYELPIDENFDSLQISPVTGLGGHNILPYKIHGSKLIFSVPDEEVQGNSKMEEGEVYAIETFATTGDGNMTQDNNLENCSHFMLNGDCKSKRFFKKNVAYKSIKPRNGMPFTLSWCDMSHKKFERDLKSAIKLGDIIAYPALVDVEYSKVAQFEHTLRIKGNCVEIYSKGDDY
jgi:methionyl aminopeptidase